MAALTHLPHIKNIASGINKYDPVHKSLFEVYFSLPAPLQQEFQADAEYLTQQVLSVNGLDALQKTTDVGEQKFYGVTVSFSNPIMDSGTAANFTIVFNLNLRNVTDNFVLKIFKAWANVNYDLSDGTRGIKQDYISDVMRIAEANRNGEVWRSFIFHNIILAEITGLGEIDYSSNEPAQLSVRFRSDYWDDDMA